MDTLPTFCLHIKGLRVNYKRTALSEIAPTLCFCFGFLFLEIEHDTNNQYRA